jgi:hypothetical protein
MHRMEMTDCRELTLADILTDPVVRAVMDADRVNRSELAQSLGETARALRRNEASRRKLRSFWPPIPPKQPSANDERERECSALSADGIVQRGVDDIFTRRNPGERVG